MMTQLRVMSRSVVVRVAFFVAVYSFSFFPMSCGKKDEKSGGDNNSNPVTAAGGASGNTSGNGNKSKDSVDLEAPSISILNLNDLGPNYSPGMHTIFSGVVDDNGNGIGRISVSLQRGSGSCLNTAVTSFSASCPNYITVKTGTLWTFVVPDSVFSAGLTYTIIANASNANGSAGATTKGSFLWDQTSPSGIGSFNVEGGLEENLLTWSAAPGASSYLIFANPESAVLNFPAPGYPYYTGNSLGDTSYVAYAGSNLSFKDQNLEEFIEYFYSIFPLDKAKNIGPSISGSAFTVGKKKFRGIAHAAVTSPLRDIMVEFQPFGDSSFNAEQRIYEIYTATTSGGQNFDDPPVASVTGGNSVSFRDSGTSDTLYIVAKSRTPTDILESYTKELAVDFSLGSHHKIGYNGRAIQIAPTSLFLRDSYAVAKDQWNNIVFSGHQGILHVYCTENINAPYCLSREVQKTYTVAGRDGRQDGLGGDIATHSPMGYINAITVDGGGNIFVSDASYYRIRAFCYNPAIDGFCKNKKIRQAYNVAGTGVVGNGGNDLPAATTTIGIPQGMDLDAFNNIFIADFSYPMIRVICQSESGYCEGKTSGNIYRYIGTGASVDGANNIAANTAAGIGNPTSLKFDSYDNLYIGDQARRRIRVVCSNVVASGFCNGKTAGNIYHAAGSGVSGNSADNVVAIGSAVGDIYGVGIDSYGNIFFSDTTNRYIRVVCINASGSQACGGKTVGNMYIVAGNGTNTDGADSFAQAVGLGDPRHIAIDSGNNIFFSDSLQKRVRGFCQDTSIAGLCAGKNINYMYRSIGTGTSAAGLEQVPAINQPLGVLSGTAVDNLGNIFFSNQAGNQILVVCYDNDSGGFCHGKTIGNVYYVAGTGVAGNGTDGIALGRAMGVPYGIAVDSGGNVYVADYTYFIVRVVCNNVAVQGVCNGKTLGYSYKIAGTGVTGAGGNNVVPTSTNIGRPFEVAVDNINNVYFTDNTNRKVFAICYNVSSSGFCSGKTSGNMYLFAGSGTNSDGANGTATTTAMGAPTSIAVDIARNIYIGDGGFFRIRVVCSENTFGYCSGKTVGTMYRFSGTGVTGNGVDDAVALGTAHGTPGALAVDPQGNVYMADLTYFFIRSYCNNVAAPGFCNGKTIANTYRLFGNGADYDGVSNIQGVLTGLGNGFYGGLAVHPAGHLIRVDDYNSIRVFFKN